MEWISVKDRLPEKVEFGQVKYLVYDDYWKIHIALWDNRFKCTEPEEITHWMPLPDPPTK